MNTMNIFDPFLQNLQIRKFYEKPQTIVTYRIPVQISEKRAAVRNPFVCVRNSNVKLLDIFLLSIQWFWFFFGKLTSSSSSNILSNHFRDTRASFFLEKKTTSSLARQYRHNVACKTRAIIFSSNNVTRGSVESEKTHNDDRNIDYNVCH